MTGNKIVVIPSTSTVTKCETLHGNWIEVESCDVCTTQYSVCGGQTPGGAYIDWEHEENLVSNYMTVNLRLSYYCV